MLPLRQHLQQQLRAFLRSDWEENAPLRWTAQLAAGALPGLVLVAIIMHMASQPTSLRRNGASVASVVPLLSASAIADTAAFHRLEAAKDTTSTPQLQFRSPLLGSSKSGPKRVITITKRTSPLPVDFRSPRTEWNHLASKDRESIDRGAAQASRSWQRVVLHGTTSSAKSLTALTRYHSAVHGIADGAAYHFVITPGTNDRYTIEISPRWIEGREWSDASLGDGSIHICLVGDFDHVGPSKAQLSALDELLDYLQIKLGHLSVTSHQHLAGDESHCLGSKFPVEQVIKAAEQ